MDGNGSGSRLTGVAVHAAAADLLAADHDRGARDVAADRIATLLGLPRLRAPGPGPVYAVPSDTLTTQAAAGLGLSHESHLYGGIAPRLFMASKAISHPLPYAGAAAPQGWNPGLGEALAACVLKGFTVFDRTDALHAGLRLLTDGPVRVKDVHANAAAGQTAVRSAPELIAALQTRDTDAIVRHGLVLEENLEDPETLSVGTARIGERRIAYWGVQRFEDLASGATIYAGSDLQVAQGGLDDLLAFDLPDKARRAVALARAYDAAAFKAYPGLVVSRRNYDVIVGRDVRGETRFGVLEQSWRIGGASGAEIAAMEAFRDDPSPRLVISQTMEVRSTTAPVPETATLYYRGVDSRIGPITKYARVLR